MILTKQLAEEQARFLLQRDAPLVEGATLLAGKAFYDSTTKIDHGGDLGFKNPIATTVEPGRKSGQCGTQSQYDAGSEYVATVAAQDAATERLAEYRAKAGPVPFEALVEAAMGMRLDEIGGGPLGNKQASARGRDRIRSAVIAIVESQNGIEFEPLKLAA